MFSSIHVALQYTGTCAQYLYSTQKLQFYLQHMTCSKFPCEFLNKICLIPRPLVHVLRVQERDQNKYKSICACRRLTLPCIDTSDTPVLVSTTKHFGNRCFGFGFRDISIEGVHVKSSVGNFCIFTHTSACAHILRVNEQGNCMARPILQACSEVRSMHVASYFLVCQ